MNQKPLAGRAGAVIAARSVLPRGWQGPPSAPSPIASSCRLPVGVAEADTTAGGASAARGHGSHASSAGRQGVVMV